jgi:hypothetical protein
MEFIGSKGFTTTLHECVVSETCMNRCLAKCIIPCLAPLFRPLGGVYRAVASKWFSGLLSPKLLLASRCLAMDYSGFEALCHNIIHSYRDLLGIPEGKRPLRRTGRR